MHDILKHIANEKRLENEECKHEMHINKQTNALSHKHYTKFAVNRNSRCILKEKNHFQFQTIQK